MTKRVLLKDIVIPAGTVFDDAPVRTDRSAGCYVETVIGLTPNTAGFLTYQVSDDLGEWFAPLRGRP
jgi:hypothetical protein